MKSEIEIGFGISQLQMPQNSNEKRRIIDTFDCNLKHKIRKEIVLPGFMTETHIFIHKLI